MLILTDFDSFAILFAILIDVVLKSLQTQKGLKLLFRLQFL